MSKAILVMDMPKKCDECIIRQNNLAFCQAARKSTSHYPSGKPIDERKRPDWCPLKPIPEKLEYTLMHHQSYVCGWNDCIDAIMGGKTDD